MKTKKMVPFCRVRHTLTAHQNLAILVSFEKASFWLALPPKTNLQCCHRRALPGKSKRKNHTVSLAHGRDVTERRLVIGVRGMATLASRERGPNDTHWQHHSASSCCSAIVIKMRNRARKFHTLQKFGKRRRKRAVQPKESWQSSAATSIEPSGTANWQTPRCSSPTQRQPPNPTASDHSGTRPKCHKILQLSTMTSADLGERAEGML